MKRKRLSFFTTKMKLTKRKRRINKKKRKRRIIRKCVDNFGCIACTDIDNKRKQHFKQYSMMRNCTQLRNKNQLKMQNYFVLLFLCISVLISSSNNNTSNCIFLYDIFNGLLTQFFKTEINLAYHSRFKSLLWSFFLFVHLLK